MLISAICEFLDLCYLAASTLSGHWKLLTMLAERLQQKITPEQEAEFDMVLALCKPPVDNKMLVSKTLLNELCDAAEQVFQEYDATLMKAILLTAWGGFMRISEYTAAKNDAKDYNIAADCVDITNDGIGLEFKADKTMDIFSHPRHHLTTWDFLPEGARDVMEQYVKLRPMATKFFMRFDGQEVTQNDFRHFLDSCLLLTRWRFLHVVPHALRVEGASEARHHGYFILTVRFIGRWMHNSSVIEAYTRLNLISLDPLLAQCDKPAFVREWKWLHILYIAWNTIQMQGTRMDHRVMKVLQQFFPDYWEKNAEILPSRFPAVATSYKLRAMIHNRRSGYYINQAIERKQYKLCLHNFRKEMSHMAKTTAVLGMSQLKKKAVNEKSS